MDIIDFIIPIITSIIFIYLMKMLFDVETLMASLDNRHEGWFREPYKHTLMTTKGMAAENVTKMFKELKESKYDAEDHTQETINVMDGVLIPTRAIVVGYKTERDPDRLMKVN